MGSNDMASAEQFGAWLAQAMRRAGYDIDAQRGGGRNALAEKMKISKSTVTRWLSGEVLPAAEYFEPLAEALNVKATDVLIGAGIISVGDLSGANREITPQEAVAALGITDPADADTVLAMIDLLRSRLEAQPPARRSFTQRGVGGHPRAHTLKEFEQPEE